jgi:hypothetical protein
MNLVAKSNRTPHNQTHGFSGLGRNFQPAVRKKMNVVASLMPTATYMERMLHFVDGRRGSDVRQVAIQSDSDQIQQNSGAVKKQNNLTRESQPVPFQREAKTRLRIKSTKLQKLFSNSRGIRSRFIRIVGSVRSRCCCLRNRARFSLKLLDTPNNRKKNSAARREIKQMRCLKRNERTAGRKTTRHTSHVTRHTSHVTRHTSHVTRHTSHVTHHTRPLRLTLLVCS